jgi:hypothetical protein
MQRYLAIGTFLALAASAGGCSDDDSGDGGSTAGTAGSGGSAGAAGSAGSGGSAGTAGSAGSGGSAGAAGAAGSDGGGNGDGDAGVAGELSFFVTSTGSGDAGGNVGGLEGADEKCQDLAEAVGSTRTWHAYLSTTEENAVDRIGEGPWFNADGVLVAADLETLHSAGLPRAPVNLVLDENGDAVPGNQHDILTGSDDDGELLVAGDAGVADNCNDWTSNSADPPGARVGHSDIPANPMFSPSWNSAHTTAGCSAAQLTAVGGAGRLYCFAE